MAFDTTSEANGMKMVRMQIQLPELLKVRLDAKRQEGYTAAGFIRRLLERELGPEHTTPKRRPSR
jgi:hypothetical protein